MRLTMFWGSVPGLFLSEDAGMDVLHEVSSWRVDHHEAHVVFGLEAAMEVHQERVADHVDHFEDPLLTHKAAHKHQQNL